MTNRLILAFEKIIWNNGRLVINNCNGRSEPTTKIASHQQLINMDSYERSVYQDIVDPDAGLFLRQSGNVFQLFVNNLVRHGTCQALSIEEVPAGHRYFYMIHIQHMKTFVDWTSHIAVDQRVMADLRSGLAWICLMYTNEGDLVDHVPLLNGLIASLGVPASQILVFASDHKTDNYSHCDFIYIPVNPFIDWVDAIKLSASIDYRPEKLFVTYNRAIRPHRMMLIYKLIELGLIQTGIYSLGAVDAPSLLALASNPGFQDQRILDQILSLSDTSPDNRDLKAHNPSNNDVNLDHHERAFVSLVTETCSGNRQLFITEKTFKPMALGHPFMVLGCTGTLAHLHSLGFRTFGQFWDESYDQETDTACRINKILGILKQLNQHTPHQLQQIRENMKHILDHNRQLINHMNSTRRYGVYREAFDHMKKMLDSAQQ